jgi:hypothetical protein
MNITIPKRRIGTVEEAFSEQAVKRLTRAIFRDFSILIESRDHLNHIFRQWALLMVRLRDVEKRFMIERKPSADDLIAHRDAVNAMICCADAIVSAAQRHLEVNRQLSDTERNGLSAEIDLVGRHRKILAFEFNGWHAPRLPLKRDQAIRRAIRESSRKAA